MKPTLLLATALLVGSARAQSLFPHEAELTKSPAGEGFISGDLNGDGYTDSLVSSALEARTKLLLGDGSYDFGSPIDLELYTPGYYPWQIVDLDSDGRNDILFRKGLLGAPTSFLWGRQTGDLEFVLSDALTHPESNRPPRLMDLGGSGAGEFAVVVLRPQVGAEVYRWNGITFDAAPMIVPFTGLRPDSILVTDVDGDGVDDLVAHLWNENRWRVSSYLGGDSFTAPRSFLPPLAEDAQSIRLGDLDGDGDVDLVALDRDVGASPSFFVYERLPSGSFGPPVEYVASALLGDGLLELIDFDGDGMLDIQVGLRVDLGSGTYTFRPSWFRNQGALTFATEQALGAFPIGDVNGDGRTEGRIVYFGELRYRSGGGVSPDDWYSTTHFLGETLPSVADAFAADADGDSDLDLLFNFGSTAQYMFENLGGLGFTSFREVEGSPIVPDDLILEADFVGDSELDRLLGKEGSPLYIERVVAPGVYEPRVEISPALSGRAFPVDVDGDGDLDIIRAREFPASANIFFIENIGVDFQFPRRIIVSAQEGAVNPFPVDIDGDGLPELLTGESSIQGIAVRQNIGGGDFGPPALLDDSLGSGFYVTDSFDFDGDGDADLIGGIHSDSYWAENLGQSDFAAPVQLGSTVFFKALADIDGNGLVDFVQLNEANYRLQVSPGVMGPIEEIAPGLPDPWVRALEDFDGDGDMDACVSTSSKAVYIVENIATPALGEPASICATGSLNSAGLPGELRAYGTGSVTSASFQLSAVQLPSDRPGFFLGSLAVGSPVAVPGSSGSICLRGAIGRYIGPGQVQNSGPAGSFSVDLQSNSLATPTGSVAAQVNETWYFQAWHRDIDSNGAPTSQFTHALAIQFTP